MKNKVLLYGLLFFIATAMVSCKKYLETKSVQTLATPSTLDDLQAMLDNPDLTHGAGGTFGGTDEYYVTYTDWLSRGETQKKSYIWDSQLNYFDDWSILYKNVFYANNVLLNLENFSTPDQKEKKNQIKGAALFLRSYAFYQLAQVYAPQYDPGVASKDLGIVLRLNADFNEKSVRSTVQENYNQIITDIESAISLLPNNISVNKIRPGKAACYALLAKVYLQTGNYEKAKESAGFCLNLYNTLLDYNSLVPVTTTYPITFNNPEILFYSKTETPLNANSFRAKADSNLYQSYVVNDLRKIVFYRPNADGSQAFRGNYSGEDFVLFNGLATDEVYLVRAEANARLGHTADALQDLNTLMQKRWVAGMFVPFTASTSKEALDLVLEERRKELVNRGTRWSDLKRLNKETQNAVTLTRNLNGQVYSLAPNDLRYTYLIPREVINVTDLAQNPR